MLVLLLMACCPLPLTPGLKFSFSATIATVATLLVTFATALDCSFEATRPRQYLARQLIAAEDISIDGNLDERAWADVPWTEDFVDISLEDVVPRLKSRVKLRWHQDWLFLAAELEEPQVWANISNTCHCLNPDEDQVIFHDNDFEIFVDADGSNHNYKEFEMNAFNQTWDLLLNKPYGDDGFENSSRVFGDEGWDMQPPLHSGVIVDPPEALNNALYQGRVWTLEVALPVGKLVEGTRSEGAKVGGFWRINFSRVEWTVVQVGNAYWKDPAHPAEDNWVWSPQGEIQMHLPERWGFLFFGSSEGEAQPFPEEEWTLRQVAMGLYYAEQSFSHGPGGGSFTDDLVALLPFLSWPDPDPEILLGVCSSPPVVTLGNDGASFMATIVSLDFSLTATITHERLLTIDHSLQRFEPIIEVF